MTHAPCVGPSRRRARRRPRCALHDRLMAQRDRDQPRPAPAGRARRARCVASTEIDIRLFGMVVALAVIWIGFHILSGGDFLTARNLWNLSVQSASIAIMATGMVLIIVSRNIDLSVGSLLGFLGYTMAMVQTEWIPNTLGPRVRPAGTRGSSPSPSASSSARRSAASRASSSPTSACRRSSSRSAGSSSGAGLIFRYQQGQTLAPLDKTFQLLGGGTAGLARRVAELAARRPRVRRDRLQHRARPAAAAGATGFALRPLGVDIGLGVLGGLVVLAAVWVANSYPWPRAAGQARTPPRTASSSRRAASRSRPASPTRSSS